MKANNIIIAIIASAVLATPVLAQNNNKDSSAESSIEASSNPGEHRRGPIDKGQFTNIDDLKAADTNKDGILSREEIEAHALSQMVKRAADRMERRLDVKKDGKISLEAIEKHRAEKFAELDTNKDGKLDRSEMKAGWKKDKDGKHHGKHHGKRDRGEHEKAEQPKAD